MRGVSNKHCLLTFFIYACQILKYLKRYKSYRGHKILSVDQSQADGYIPLSCLSGIIAPFHFRALCGDICQSLKVFFRSQINCIRARNHKMFDRIANMEDPDQTTSVCQGSFWQATRVHIL